MNHRFKEYQPLKEVFQDETMDLYFYGKRKAIPYSLISYKTEVSFLLDPGEEIYEGQVIGENSRGDDMVVNITKLKS